MKLSFLGNLILCAAIIGSSLPISVSASSGRIQVGTMFPPGRAFQKLRERLARPEAGADFATSAAQLGTKSQRSLMLARAKSVGSAVVKAPLREVVGVGPTLIAIFVLANIEAVRQKLHMEGLTKPSVRSADVRMRLETVAAESLNSLPIFGKILAKEPIPADSEATSLAHDILGVMPSTMPVYHALSMAERAVPFLKKVGSAISGEHISSAPVAGGLIGGAIGGMTGHTGSYLISLTVGKYLEQLAEALRVIGIRPLVLKLFGTGALSIATFTGWFLGEQTFSMAIEQIENETDHIIAKHLNFWKVLIGQGSADENRVFSEILVKAVTVVWATPEFRNSLIYNVWRLSLGTGEFISIVSSMVVAGTVGGKYAGMVVGMIAGPGSSLLARIGGGAVGAAIGVTSGIVAGIFAAYVMPEWATEAITEKVQDMRFARARQGLENSYSGISQLVNLFRIGNHTGSANFDVNAPGAQEMLVENLGLYQQNNTSYRNDAVTVFIERVFKLVGKQRTAQMELQIVKKTYPADAPELKAMQESVEKVVDKTSKGIWQGMRTVLEFYQMDFDRNEAQVKRSDVSLPQSVHSKFEAANDGTVSARTILLSLAAHLNPTEFKESFPNAEAVEIEPDLADGILSTLFTVGFSETEAMNFIEDSVQSLFVDPPREQVQ